MQAITTSTHTVDFYFNFLQHLEPDSKLDLIAKLSASMKRTPESGTEPALSLFGALITDESADELLMQLRAARITSRTIEPL